MDKIQRLLKILKQFIILRNKMKEVEKEDIFFTNLQDEKNNKRRVEYLCEIIDDKTIEELKEINNWINKTLPPEFCLYIYSSYTKEEVMHVLFHHFKNYYDYIKKLEKIKDIKE